MVMEALIVNGTTLEMLCSDQERRLTVLRDMVSMVESHLIMMLIIIQVEIRIFVYTDGQETHL